MKESYQLYADRLNREYRTVFEQVELYLTTLRVDDVRSEEQLSELLDLFLSAQQAGKPVKSIVGGDIERFCVAFCSGYGWKERIFNGLYAFKSVAWWMLVISAFELFCLLIDPDSRLADFWNTDSAVNLSGYLIGFFIALALSRLCSFVIRRIMFRTRRFSMRVLQCVQLAADLVSCALLFVLILSDSTKFWNCPDWVLALASGGYLALFYLFFHRQAKERTQQTSRFRDVVNTTIETSFGEEMEEKYAKASARSVKRGKGPLPLEAFLDKEEKDCRLTEKLDFLYYLFPLVIVAPFFLQVQRDGGFEGALDALVFLVLMLAIEYAIALGLLKFFQKATACRMAWVRSKRKALASGEPPRLEGAPDEEP